MPSARSFDEEAWSDLTTIIELGNRLRFVLVECENEGVRAALREKLRAHCEADERPFLAPDAPGREVLGWLIDQQGESAMVPPAERERVQPVRFFPVPTGQDETFVLNRLNENRDNLKRDLRGVLVLAGLKDFLRRAAQAADLWSMREKTFEVSARDLPPLSLPAAASPPVPPAPEPTYAYQALLSFTYRDKAVAEALRARLERDGVRVFLADAAEPVDEKALGESRFIVILLSPDYVGVGWPKVEPALRASRNERALLEHTVPLLVRPVGAPGYLRQYTPLDWLSEKSREQAYPQLLNVLQGRGTQLPAPVTTEELAQFTASIQPRSWYDFYKDEPIMKGLYVVIALGSLAWVLATLAKACEKLSP